jgi:hypothetical protein
LQRDLHTAARGETYSPLGGFRYYCPGAIVQLSCNELSFIPWSSYQRSEMLHVLSDQVRECHTRAKECARKAAEQLDDPVRQSFLDAEQCWLRLVRRLALIPEPEGDELPRRIDFN